MADITARAIRRIPHESSGIVALPASAAIRPYVPAPEGIGFSDCWRIMRRRSNLIFGLLAAALLTTLLITFCMTPNFAASSTLLIEPAPAQVLDIKELVDEQGSTQDYDYYKTQFVLLKSRDLAAIVIRDLDLTHIAPFASEQPGFVTGLFYSLLPTFNRLLSSSAPQQKPDPDAVDPGVIDNYLHRLKVKPEIGTRLVVISFSAPNPALAQHIVQAHVSHYINRDLDLRNESRRSAVSFLQRELTELKGKVESSEAALQAYRRKNGIVSFDVQDRNTVAQRRMENLTRALTVETKRITAEAQTQLVRSGSYESLPQVIANPVIATLEPRVQELQAQYADMSAAFSPKYPKLAELKAHLEEARAGLRREIQRVADAVQRQYKAAADEENSLRAAIESEKERDFALNDASLQDTVLAREVESNRQLYKTVLLRMQQIAVGEQSPISNINVVEHAVAPNYPSSPNTRKYLAISGLLVLVIGIACAFVLEQLDDRLKTSEEAEQYLLLPTLAVAPDFAKLDTPNGWLRLLSNMRWLPNAYARRAARANQTIHHAAAEGDVYRSIRNALLFSRGDPPPKLVLFTSGIEAEGKTWTAVQTALAFARTESTVLLIDADLRRSRCHEALGFDNPVGLSDVLSGEYEPADVICFLEDRNLFLLSAGSRVTNASELLTSSRMSRLLVQLSQVYDFILIDSAPIMSASDTAGMATMTDGVVLVAGANTSKQDVRRAAELLSLVGAKVLGVVLNRMDLRGTDYERYSRYYASQDLDIEVSQGANSTPVLVTSVELDTDSTKSG
jgi:succinoglycan biosynthesis transport protein ExoP